MESNGTRIAALLVTLAVIVGLFFAFKGGGDDDSTTATTATTTTTDGGEKRDEVAGLPSPTAPVINVVDGEPKGGVADLEFEKGDQIVFEVNSDTADEVHVHGYDIGKDVEAGGSVKLDFPADIEGVFEVELESSAIQIAELTVNP